MEGHDRRRQACVERRADDGSMTDVDPVEGADRDRPRPAFELAG